MPRSFPAEVDLAKITFADGAAEKKEYTIQVVTPLFGGGVEAGKNDPDMLIRAASIRGHLRFWWRATRGAEYSSVDKMRAAESDIWGSTEKPSEIGVRVKIENNGKVFANGQPAYALFPFQENRRLNKPAKTGIEGIKFTLTLTYPKEWARWHEVEIALWAWVNFGGIGARTRRGCGALFCAGLAFRKFSLPKKYRLLLGKEKTSATTAWNDIIEIYKSFRQAPHGRNGSQGRSLWNEPDAIRKITGKTSKRHQENFPAKPAQTVFPRAEFGLPIIFHFKDQREGDPGDTELLPFIKDGSADRMSSPLILKPLALDNNKFVPAALLLNDHPLEKVILKKSGTETPFPVRLPAAAYDKSPLKNRAPNGSALAGALAGFRKFLTGKENNFTEVTP
ncbi:type III-B CRISPR module RAMP protein Cmr1 [Planctomycetales bacterium]|nr:type III-B CRISPR module RAMP protein Cmr1 [Planctomycetales bacterium]GHT00747.1 type III-B CRISPR module RAMP protein Cmr1 [Planctomycetales bacterium]GHT04418.1 type III-B CRISPR module RAMP protein Cmr1 [Planctomycetales bacterium]